jgi:hypothetical protein
MPSAHFAMGSCYQCDVQTALALLFVERNRPVRGALVSNFIRFQTWYRSGSRKAFSQFEARP